MIEQLAAKCQVCGTPMTVGFDTESELVISRERYIKFATCDPCMIKLRRFPRSQAPKEIRQVKLPYRDDD